MSHKLYFAFITACLLPLNTVSAVDYSANASGPWDDPNTWLPVGTPTKISQVTIGSGHHVIITNNDAVCSNWIVSASGSCTIGTGAVLTNYCEGVFYGAVTQNAGIIHVIDGTNREHQVFHNWDAGGYTLNGGQLKLEYGIKVGGSAKYGQTNGLLTINGGLAEFPGITLGYLGHGRMVITDGTVTNTASLVIGRGAPASDSLGELVISGGVYSHRGTPYTGLAVGGDLSMSAIGSTGIVTQTGGLLMTDHHKPHLIIGYTTVGKYYLSGGQISLKNDLIIGYTDSGNGLLSVSGGDIDIYEDTFLNICTGVLEIVGAGCTNFNVGSGFIMNSNGTLRAICGNDGLSLINVHSNIILSNATFEMGAEPDYEGTIGDNYYLMKTDEAYEIITNGISISNINEDFEFAMEVVSNYASYHWIKVTMTGPPKASCIIVK